MNHKIRGHEVKFIIIDEFTNGIDAIKALSSADNIQDTFILDSLADEADRLVRRMSPPEPEMLKPTFFRKERHHPTSPKQRGGR